MNAGRLYFVLQSLAGAVWWIAVFLVPPVRSATLGQLDPVVVATFDIPLFVVASAIAAFGVRSAALLVAGWTVLVTIGLATYATFTEGAGWGVVAMIAASAGSIAASSLISSGRIPTSWILRGPFAFRPADARAATSTNLATTLVQIAIFWTVFLVLLPSVLVVLERRWRVGVDLPGASVGIGVVVLVLGSALGLASAFVMSTRGRGTPLPAAMPNELVVAGPYRWVRNPMAVASIAQGVAVGAILSSWIVIAYAVAGAVVWNVAVRPHEEADLHRRFGEEFSRYRDAVRCWIPRIPSRIGAP